MNQPLQTPHPGVVFLAVGHDDDCPGRFADGEGCDCKPTFTLHHDAEVYIAGEALNRATRRAAAQEAERALRRARRAA